jgi:hypothetical protein
MVKELFRTEFDATTGVSTDVLLTKEEITDLKVLSDQIKANQLVEKQKAIDKAALLERLGITAEEASLLFG